MSRYQRISSSVRYDIYTSSFVPTIKVGNYFKVLRSCASRDSAEELISREKRLMREQDRHSRFTIICVLVFIGILGLSMLVGPFIQLLGWMMGF